MEYLKTLYQKFLLLLQWFRLSIQQWSMRKHYSKLRKKTRLYDLSLVMNPPPEVYIDPVPTHPGFPKIIKTIVKNLGEIQIVDTLSVGDSILDFLRGMLTAVKARFNFNLAGSWSPQILEVLAFIKKTFPFLKIRNLVIGCGWGNEALQFESLPLMKKHLLEMLDGARKLYPETKIIYHGAPPVFHPWAIKHRNELDQLGKDWCTADGNAVYLDLLKSFSGPFQLFPQAGMNKDTIHLSERAGWRINQGINLAKRSKAGSVVVCPASPL
jgi:hypothetical protein